jgi:hypothetical protein
VRYRESAVDRLGEAGVVGAVIGQLPGRLVVLEDIDGSVGGAAVLDDVLETRIALPQDAFNRELDEPALIQRWRDDRYHWRGLREQVVLIEAEWQTKSSWWMLLQVAQPRVAPQCLQKMRHRQRTELRPEQDHPYSWPRR